ncbi:MAG TPA: carbon-nitrogen hydrolase family protein [Ktedonobacteraceae bacterium]|nr:carbon-nitrogen hydrolase family protein [Ktedonobacteraceae bacterium]
MEIKIAVVQCTINQFAPEKNLIRAEQFIEMASSQAQLIVFPEDFVVGPLIGRRQFADYDGRYFRHFQHLAAKYTIDIVPGSIPEGTETGIYNTTCYIDRGGNILGKYRKVNLWIPERAYNTPGTESCVFQTRFGKVGLIICWDLIFPEIFRAMAREGVEMVICPSYWCLEDAGEGMKYDENSEIKLVNALCVTRAFENEIVLVYTNAAGRLNYEGNTGTLIGQSQVTVPFKGSLGTMEHNEEEMRYFVVDTSILDDAEKAYKIREDLRKSVSA